VCKNKATILLLKIFKNVLKRFKIFALLISVVLVLQIDFNCTTFLKYTTKSDGTVDVVTCVSHYSHDDSISRLKLPEVTREKLPK
jgi:hypothetical protein